MATKQVLTSMFTQYSWTLTWSASGSKPAEFRIRNTFSTQELNEWLVAMDIMQPIISKITPDIELAEALEKSDKLYIQHLPVVCSDKDDTIVGVLDSQAVHRSLSAEVLSRQQKADIMHTVS